MSLFDTFLMEPNRANYINVREAGARGDGVSNDGPAIQSAADYLARVGGGILFFPAGIYRCARSRFLSSAGVMEISQNFSVRIMTPNVTLEGESWDAVILQDDPWTTPIFFQITNAAGLGSITVRRLKFKGDTSQRLIPITFQKGQDTGLTGALLGVWGTSSLPPLKNVAVQDCLFEDADKTSALHLAYVETALVQGCSFYHFKDFRVLGSVQYASKAGESVDVYADAVPTVDNILTAVGDRILLKDQQNKTENGVYVVQGIPATGMLARYLSRAPDFDSPTDLDSLGVVVTGGSTNGGKVFAIDRVNTKLPVALGANGHPISDYRVIEDVVSSGTFKYARFATTPTQPFQQWPPSGTAIQIDGVPTPVLTAGNVVLVKDQTQKPSQNGLYVVQLGEWTRDPTAVDEATIGQLKVLVQEGSVNRFTFWQLAPTRGPINVDSKVGTPLRFTRANIVSTPVVAVQLSSIPSPFGPYTSPNFLTIDFQLIKRGDRVLLAGQSDPTQNGVYYLADSDMLVRVAELGGAAPYDLLEKFLVKVTGGNKAGRFYALSNPPAVAGGSPIFVEQQSPGLASVACAVDDPEVAHLRLLGNQFQGDAANQGSAVGCAGLLWLKYGRSLVATGNTLLNYRLKGIRTGSGQVSVVGNNFRTVKYSDADTFAIEASPQDSSGEQFSVEATGNNAEGSGFLSTGSLSDYATAQKPVDYNVSSNRIMGVPVSASSGINLIRGRRVLLHNNLIDQCTATLIIAIANVRVLGIYPSQVDASSNNSLLNILTTQLLKDGDPVFLAPYQSLPGATDAGVLPQSLESGRVYYVKRLSPTSTQIQLYRDPKLTDRLSSFITTGSQRHVLLFGNWDCILSIVGNTVMRPVPGERNLEAILIGNKDPFYFPTGTASDTYSVPAGAGFFGHSLIGNNFLASDDTHVIGKRPFAITKVPLIMFNNRGFDSGSHRRAIVLGLVKNDKGLGGFEFQGPDEDIEVMAL